MEKVPFIKAFASIMQKLSIILKALHLKYKFCFCLFSRLNKSGLDNANKFEFDSTNLVVKEDVLLSFEFI